MPSTVRSNDSDAEMYRRQTVSFVADMISAFEIDKNGRRQRAQKSLDSGPLELKLENICT